MNISVVLCTHNRAESLGVTLRSLSELRIPAGLTWEVWVVDNNSSDHTRGVTEAAAAYLPCRYLFESRQGKSFAVNASIPHVDGSDLIVFTDDDVTMHPDWLAELWRVFAETDCEAAGGRVVPVWSCPKPRWYGESGPHALMAGVVVDYDHGNETKVVDRVAMLPFGANMAFRKGVFARHGTFKTDLGPKGKALMRGEDTDFCQRVRGAGGRVLYVGSAIVYHPVDSTRVQKKYFRAWYYFFGRRDILIEPKRFSEHLWFGVPRYVYLAWLRSAFTWLFTFEPKERFFHRLMCSRLHGQMVEYRHPSNLSD